MDGCGLFRFKNGALSNTITNPKNPGYYVTQLRLCLAEIGKSNTSRMT